MTIRNNVAGLKVSQMAKILWAPYASNHDDMTMWPQIFSQVQAESASDSQRDWTNSLQNFSLQFGEPMTGDGTGYSLTVNGSAKTLTYLSGSGTDTWTFRISALVHNGDVMALTYAPGNTVSTRTGVALPAFSSATVTNQLTKRVRFTLCDNNDANVVNTSVTGVILEMSLATLANEATVTTDSSGLYDQLYTGSTAVGGNVYVGVVDSNITLLAQQAVA